MQPQQPGQPPNHNALPGQQGQSSAPAQNMGGPQNPAKVPLHQKAISKYTMAMVTLLLFAALLGGVGVVVLVLSLPSGGQVFTLLIGIFAFFLPAVLCTVAALALRARKASFAPAQTTHQQYRAEIVLPQLHAIFQSPVFHPQPLLSIGNLHNAGLLGYWGGEFMTNDWLTGSYKGHSFTTADLCNGTPPPGSTQWLPTDLPRYAPGTCCPGDEAPSFTGRWLFLAAKKPLDGHVVLRSRFFESLKAGRTPPFAGGALQKIPVENPAFQKLFEVYATDPHTAYLLLTPQVLEALAGLVQGIQKTFGKSHGGIALAAAGPSVQVLVRGPKDAFAPSPYHPQNQPDIANARVRQEAAVITTVINALGDVVA